MTREETSGLATLERAGACGRRVGRCGVQPDCHAIGGCGVQHRPVCARDYANFDLSAPVTEILFRPRPYLSVQLINTARRLKLRATPDR